MGILLLTKRLLVQRACGVCVCVLPRVVMVMALRRERRTRRKTTHYFLSGRPVPVGREKGRRTKVE